MISIVRDFRGVHISTSSFSYNKEEMNQFVDQLDLQELNVQFTQSKQIAKKMIDIKPVREIYFMPLSPAIECSIIFEQIPYVAPISEAMLLGYSKTNNIYDALSFYLREMDKVMEGQLDELKIYSEDSIAFVSYFLVTKDEVKYYSIVDNEKAYMAQYIASLEVSNFYIYLEVFREVVNFNG